MIRNHRCIKKLYRSSVKPAIKIPPGLAGFGKLFVHAVNRLGVRLYRLITIWNLAERY
jgi:hypothetical protein